MSNPSPQRYRQLQPEDRVTLASLVQQKLSVRQMALVLGRCASTVSRELRRNASPTGYSSEHARSCAQQRRRDARAAGKLHPKGILFAVTRHFLSLRWSPEQIALTLASIYPKGHELRVSHETIYNCIYAQPVGELKRELIAALRHAHNKRAPTLPNVPTMREAGFPEVDVTSWWALYAPAGLPPAMVESISRAAERALKTDDLQEKLAKQNIEPTYGNAATLQEKLRSETDKWAKVMRSANITPE